MGVNEKDEYIQQAKERVKETIDNNNMHSCSVEKDFMRGTIEINIKMSITPRDKVNGD